MTDTKSTLIQRNRAAFEAYHPRVWNLLKDIEKPRSTLVEDAGVAENIESESGPLYPAPAADWSKTQLEDFHQQPDKIIFSDPSHCNLSPISLKLMDDLSAFIREKVGPIPSMSPRTR